MRTVIAVALAMVMIGTSGQDARAQEPCAAWAIRVDDMAGTYVNGLYPMRVDVYPCGGVVVTWDNNYGRHAAAYGVSERISTGGFVARGIMAEPLNVFLDDRTAVGVKPAEPGWVEVFTVSLYGDGMRVYRLAKIS